MGNGDGELPLRASAPGAWSAAGKRLKKKTWADIEMRVAERFGVNVNGKIVDSTAPSLLYCN